METHTMPLHPQCPHCQKHTVIPNQAFRKFGNYTPSLYCDMTIGGCGADLTQTITA